MGNATQFLGESGTQTTLTQLLPSDTDPGACRKPFGEVSSRQAAEDKAPLCHADELMGGSSVRDPREVHYLSFQCDSWVYTFPFFVLKQKEYQAGH